MTGSTFLEPAPRHGGRHDHLHIRTATPYATVLPRSHEKQRRRYAAVEAERLGRGGINYIASILHLDRKTIRRGRDELNLIEDPAGDRVRRPGGGRKKNPPLPRPPARLPEGHRRLHRRRAPAGRSLDEPPQAANRRAAQGGRPQRLAKIVAQLFKLAGLSERQARKSVALKQHPDRDAQFQKIVALKEEYLKNDQVVISVDTKKKELLGNFYRNYALHLRADQGP